ncbi:GNAT family protein [Amycolatopsis sp. NPDC023774]|uniref:GNAT family N-acetyltransferase n=1 Tax=Amycolatopsis sp. NPDC023774 TaxID=3155015 RepID=UPI0033C1A7C9
MPAWPDRRARSETWLRGPRRAPGEGYAPDAVRSAPDFAGPLDLHHVTAAIGPDNVASPAVVERLGFVREGVRDHVFTMARGVIRSCWGLWVHRVRCSGVQCCSA